jgi:hypothetical protein
MPPSSSTRAQGRPPVLEFRVAGARAAPAVTPTVVFDVAVAASGAAVRSVLLATQVRIAVERRAHDDATRERLSDLFGDPRSWATNARGLPWAVITAVVPPFEGETSVPIPMPCSYDLEVAWAKYLDALRDGAVPLELLFSGSVFYADEDGALAVARLPWDREADFDLPVSVLRQAIESCFPGAGWVRVGRETLDRLRAYRGTHALPTWDATLDALLSAPEIAEAAKAR